MTALILRERIPEEPENNNRRTTEWLQKDTIRTPEYTRRTPDGPQKGPTGTPKRTQRNTRGTPKGHPSYTRRPQRDHRRTLKGPQRTPEDPRVQKRKQMLIRFLSSSASTEPALRRPAWRSTRRTLICLWFLEMGHQPRTQHISKSLCFPSMCEPCEKVFLLECQQNRGATISLNVYFLGLPMTSYARSLYQIKNIECMRCSWLFERKVHKKP